MRTIRFFVVFLAFAFAADVRSVTQETGAPRFEEYSVVVWRGRIIPLKLRSHPLAGLYRTSMRQQLKNEGVNFAGHFTLASVGCGTGCSTTAMIDVRTGRAYFPNELNGWTSIVGDYEIPAGQDQRMFRANSRLLRVVGRSNIGKVTDERHGPSGIYYYEWANSQLHLVKFIPVGSYPEADP
jgi:hypothetical protein